MKNPMRRALALTLCLCLIVPALASCAAERNESPGQTAGRASPTPRGTEAGSEADASAPLSGTLRIAAQDAYGLTELVGGFMALHPGVTVTLDSAFGADDPEMDEAEMVAKGDAFARRIRLEMQNGEGPDLLNVFDMDFYDLFKQGLFDDLYAYMDDDPDFDRADYFENIFAALEYEEGLYAMPTTIMMEYVRLNKMVTGMLGVDAGQYDVITPMQILELYGWALDGQNVGSSFWLAYGDGGKSVLLSEFHAYLDEKEGTARFDSPEFIAYLEASQRIQTQRDAFFHDMMGVTPESLFDDGTSALIHRDITATFNAAIMVSKSNAYTRAIPLGLGKIGRDRFFYINRVLLSIAEGSENKALAWAFIQYCIAESETVTHWEKRGQWNGDRFGAFLPINRNNLKKYVAAVQKSGVGALSPSESDEIYEMLAGWAEAANKSARSFPYALFDDVLSAYYDEMSLTAEECAKQIQARAEAYLAG